MSRPGSAAAGPPELVTEALRAEAERLSEVARAQDRASFSRPSPCPPWTVGELFYHVRIALGRVAQALAGTEPAPGSGPGGLVSAVGYYRDDHRFSAAGNADRITLAQQGAASLDPASMGPASLDPASVGPASLDPAGVGPAGLDPANTDTAALARDFDQAWQQTWSLVRATPPDRVVRTRHGDYMLMTEFLRTRVVEVGVHGLDLAAGLGRDPWLTDQAAAVIEELLLPAPAAAGLRRDLGWDQVTLIVKGTGRMPLTAAEAGQFQRRGGRRLFLG